MKREERIPGKENSLYREPLDRRENHISEYMQNGRKQEGAT